MLGLIELNYIHITLYKMPLKNIMLKSFKGDAKTQTFWEISIIMEVMKYKQNLNFHLSGYLLVSLLPEKSKTVILSIFNCL